MPLGRNNAKLVKGKSPAEQGGEYGVGSSPVDLGNFTTEGLVQLIGSLFNSQFGGSFSANGTGEFYQDAPEALYLGYQTLVAQNLVGSALLPGSATSLNNAFGKYDAQVADANRANGTNLPGYTIESNSPMGLVVGEYYHNSDGAAITKNGLSGSFEQLSSAPVSGANQGGSSTEEQEKNVASIGLIIDSQETVYSVAKVFKNAPEYLEGFSKHLGIVGAVFTGGVAGEHLWNSWSHGNFGSARDWVNLGIGAASAAIIIAAPEAPVAVAVWNGATAVWDGVQIWMDHNK